MAKKSKQAKDKGDLRRRWADALARNLVKSGVCEQLSDAEEGMLLLRKADRPIYLRISFATGPRLSARVDVTLEGYRTVSKGQSPGQGDKAGRVKAKRQTIVLEAVEGKPVILKSDFKHGRLDTTVQILRDLVEVLDALDGALKKARTHYSRTRQA